MIDQLIANIKKTNAPIVVGLDPMMKFIPEQIQKAAFAEYGEPLKGADLVHFFNEDGLGAIVNSSRGIIAAYQQEKYAQFGAANYADASRQAVIDMREDIAQALQGRK